MIQIVRQPATPEQMRLMLEALGIYIKLAVDLDRKILAGGGELHADCEQILLQDSSRQVDVWGADWYPLQHLRSSRLAQIESLTLNLARIQSLADAEEAQVAYHLVRESQFFIEWIVPTIDLELDLVIATTLVDLQRQLSSWKINWSTLWQDATARQTIAAEAQVWLDRLQEQSIRLAS